MTDRELLEAASKAAGLRGIWCDAGINLSTDAWPIIWNPLTDDGDALRLAVKMRMMVEPWGAGAAAVVFVDNKARVAETHYGDDPERATRRAIVRAAAALHKSPD
jgi:hypothetical protein